MKRKRDEAGSEMLIIEAPRSKKAQTMHSALSALSFDDTERHCFRRLETLDAVMANSVARSEDDATAKRLLAGAKALSSRA